MKGIYLLLGSNLGNREQILDKARILVNNRIGRVITSSSIYATKAWGIEDQPDFLNQVIEIDSHAAPEKVLALACDIEANLGRKRKIKWGSRIIDIDILYFGDVIVESEHLKIPHPEIQNRNFVLAPMMEIAPDFIHPKLCKTQKELWEQCLDKLKVKRCL